MNLSVSDDWLVCFVSLAGNSQVSSTLVRAESRGTEGVRRLKILGYCVSSTLRLFFLKFAVENDIDPKALKCCQDVLSLGSFKAG
jgi:hypothetical protein